jgi:RNA polymerase sigma factor (sigma-70 family)
MVLGLCRLLLRDPVEAEDATQQVFLAAHRSVLGGAPPRDPHAWLAAIARNECRARIQARQREPLKLPELPSDLPDPLAAAIRAADLEAIWAAISSLPRRQRRALLLREVGGLSYRELGRALGITDSSVESLLFRARRHVRSLVATAVPFTLRDELARLIPGFDPASASLVGRAVSLPLALKLATAAVSVGVVTSGAAQFRDGHARNLSTTHPTGGARVSPAAARRVAPRLAARPVVVREQFVSREAEHRSAHGVEREHQAGGEREHRGRDEQSQEQQQAASSTEPAPAEATQAENPDTSSDNGSGPGPVGPGPSGDGEAPADDG